MYNRLFCAFSKNWGPAAKKNSSLGQKINLSGAISVFNKKPQEILYHIKLLFFQLSRFKIIFLSKFTIFSSKKWFLALFSMIFMRKISISKNNLRMWQKFNPSEAKASVSLKNSPPPEYSKVTSKIDSLVSECFYVVHETPPPFLSLASWLPEESSGVDDVPEKDWWWDVSEQPENDKLNAQGKSLLLLRNRTENNHQHRHLKMNKNCKS